MKRAVLIRLQGLPDRTLGALYIFEGITRLGQFAILEPPWRSNTRGESCIPPGCYRLAPRAPSQRFNYPHLIVKDTAPREAILLHHGNFPIDTEGCQLPGMSFGSADSDGKPDVLSSRTALNLIVQLVDREIPYDIVDLTEKTL